jgi:hypothetical protein
MGEVAREIPRHNFCTETRHERNKGAEEWVVRAHDV